MEDNYRFGPVFAAACISLLFFGVGVTSLGSVLPEMITRFNLSDIEAGALTSLLPAGILAGSLVFGPLVDRYSYRMLLFFCLVFIGAGLLGVAFGNSLFITQLSLMLIGFGGGAINGGGSALVADISMDRPGGPGANLSLLGVFFGIGALGMPAVMSFFSRWHGYQDIVAVIGGVVALSSLYLLFVRFPQPKHAQGFPLKQGLALLRDIPLLSLGFVLFFQSGMEGLVNNWTPVFLQNALQAEPARALAALSLSVLGLTMVRMLLSWLLRHVRPYLVLVSSMVVSMLGTLLVLTASGMTAATIGFILIGMGLSAFFPVVLGYVGQLYPSISGTALGLTLAIAVTGNVVMNFLMGVVAQEFGIGRYPLLIIACLLIQVVLLLFGLRQIREKIHI